MQPLIPAALPPASPGGGPVVAAFDFDGTLTQGDTLIPFLARGLGWPALAGVMLRCSPWLAGYALRLVRNDVAKARLLKAALAGRALAQIDGWTRDWLADDFAARLRPDAMARLAAHRAAGHACVMVSASPDIYLVHVAERLGFDGLLCTGMEVEVSLAGTQRLSGRLRTPNCHGEEKVVRLRAWLAARYGAAADSVTLHAYGDTSGDKPMLRMARHAWLRGRPWSADRGA